MQILVPILTGIVTTLIGWFWGRRAKVRENSKADFDTIQVIVAESLEHVKDASDSQKGYLREIMEMRKITAELEKKLHIKEQNLEKLESQIKHLDEVITDVEQGLKTLEDAKKKLRKVQKTLADMQNQQKHHPGADLAKKASVIGFLICGALSWVFQPLPAPENMEVRYSTEIRVTYPDNENEMDILLTDLDEDELATLLDKYGDIVKDEDWRNMFLGTAIQV